MSVSLPLLAIIALFVYRAPALSGAGVIDPDYYWHLAYGDWIVAHRALPTVDFWSWTYDGHSYRLTQWLGEVAISLANQIGGTYGTSTLAAGLVAITIGASYRTARYYLDNRLAALAVAVGCNAILVSLACRPHQFTHLCLALVTWILASYESGNRRALWCIPPLMAIWVNLHGGYAFGFVYIGLFAGAEALTAYMQHDYARLRSYVVPIAIATVIGLAASLLNPYGWGAWQYAIEIAQMKSSSAGIVDEWAATSVKTEVGMNFFFVSAAVFAAMALSQRRPTASNVMLAVALAAMGWSAVRISIMTTVLMVPLLAAALRHTALYDLAFDGDGRRYDTCIRSSAALLTLLAVGATSIGMTIFDKTTERAVTEKMPVAEGRFIEQHALATGRLLNPPDIGGYLIRQHGLKVSLDTRLDLYGDRALFEWLFASRGADGWRDYVTRLDPDLILVGNPASLRGLLADSGLYRPVFEGPSYTVLVRGHTHPELPTIELSRPSANVLNLLKS